MGTVELRLEAHGPAAPELAWERYALPALWPTWSPQIRAVEAGPRLAPGMTGRVRPYLGPALPFRVLSVDESVRTWSWEVRLGPLRLVLDHAVRAQGSGTATTLEVRGPAPVVLGYAPLARLALALLVR